MKNALLIFFFATLLTSADALAQWTATGAWPPSRTWTVAMHGVAVDGEGKVWLSPFGGTDSVFTAQGVRRTIPALYVYNPDGSAASFSPIRILTVGGDTDTLRASNRGLVTDENGDIIYSGFVMTDVQQPAIWRINHQTGQATHRRITTPPLDVRGISAAAVDDLGNVFVSGVFPDDPIAVYDTDLNFVENAVDVSVGFSRSLGVTADGNTIYWAGYSNLAIFKYTRPDEFSPFESVPDTLFRGATVESFERDPTTGYVWFSAGPSGSGSAFNGFSDHTWYAIDPATDELVDSLKWDVSVGIAIEKPRGFAIAPDGLTAYAVMFDATSGQSSVQRFVKGAVAIEKDPTAVPEQFALSQNYPNPFNPSTQISFDLATAGTATLKVYDTLGREVATLVDGHLTAGSYKAGFDASNLASGVYLYVLSVDGQRASRTMMLMK